MELIICKDEDAGSKRAYQIIKDTLKKKPNLVLGLATGTSPIKLYKLMIEDNLEGNTTYADVKTFNLDEYIGLSEDHEQSYRYFMNQTLFNHLDILTENTYVPQGVGDPCQNAEEYDEILKDLGPADIQILGIGSNGHIAFNEPGTDFNLTTHITDLTKSTIEDNSRLFNDINEVPTKALTMGISSIMKAKKIILLAFGEKKADAIKKLLSGEITSEFPASILNNHNNTCIICDEKSVSKLN